MARSLIKAALFGAAVFILLLIFGSWALAGWAPRRAASPDSVFAVPAWQQAEPEAEATQPDPMKGPEVVLCILVFAVGVGVGLWALRQNNRRKAPDSSDSCRPS